jgi:uncharacterized protein (DUF433 family)
LREIEFASIGMIHRGRQDEFARVTVRRVMMTGPPIVSDPRVMMGKPVVAGTRITVDLILEKLGNGEPVEAMLEAHPRLTREGVLAALRFAAQALRAEVVYPVSSKSA